MRLKERKREREREREERKKFSIFLMLDSYYGYYGYYSLTAKLDFI